MLEQFRARDDILDSKITRLFARPWRRTETSMNQLLETKNIIKYYGNGSNVTKALNDVSFSMGKGEFTAIMGASGSGKTTLLNIIATIEPLSAGALLLDGQDVAALRETELAAFRRDKLGFIFQDYNLLDTLTIEENITLPLNLQNRNPKEIKERLKDITGKLSIEDQLKKFPQELSGGQRQRAACARALITEPSLILADEPTGALDSANSKALMQTFSTMNQDFHASILMVTHDAIVGSYASRVLFLKDGKIWNELYRGEKSRQELYHEIINVMSVLGGEADVR